MQKTKNTAALQEADVPEATPAGSFQSLTTHDPSEYEEALSPWELMCRPVSRGRFQHVLDMFSSPSLLVYRESYSLGVRLRGLTPAGMLGFGFPVAPQATATYWGRLHTGRSAPATVPGTLEAMVEPGHQQIVAFLNIGTLREALPEESVGRLMMMAERHSIEGPEKTLTCLSILIERTLARLRRSPDLASSPGFEAALFAKIVAGLEGIAVAHEPLAGRHGHTGAESGFRRAVELLRETTSMQVSTRELARAVGISQRSLQYKFREHLGISPQRFQRMRRMHAVRRALMKTKSNETLITRIAIDHGYTELGRFSGEYKATFGELPSQTLAG